MPNVWATFVEKWCRDHSKITQSGHTAMVSYTSPPSAAPRAHSILYSNQLNSDQITADPYHKLYLKKSNPMQTKTPKIVISIA